ncbi:hypothetical protein [Pantoea agglomerans]|uniref:Uncharacterized protein n=1 Tax=Enterobacter agglomerans TaxID=549 RepID=A0A7X2MI54_ENTAG|nr:hypothetical protein [Pantoea agglomerans]MSE13702.1 hypothetical protein [Pantoea agglomerans]
MLLQDDGNGHVIIGVAALHLALAKKEISVISLIAELGYMAADKCSDERLTEISEARSWLKRVITPDRAEHSEPYLRTLASLNEEKN